MRIKMWLQFIDRLIGLLILVGGFIYLFMGNDQKAILYMVLYLVYRKTDWRMWE